MSPLKSRLSLLGTTFLALLLFYPSVASALTSYTIRDDTTGGDCSTFALWDDTTNTCTLTSDLTARITLFGPNLTLDGADHTLTGEGGFDGVLISRSQNATVKNISVTNFTYGVRADRSEKAVVDNVHTYDNQHGLYLYFSGNGTTTASTFLDNSNTGLYLANSPNVLVANITTEGLRFGMRLGSSPDSTVLDTIVENSGDGFDASNSPRSTLLRNTIRNNVVSGFVGWGSENLMLRDNVFENSHFNFRITHHDGLYDNDIDTSNTADGKPVYYLQDEVDTTYDASDNVGAFYCIRCENVTLKNTALPTSFHGAFLFNSTSTKVENITAEGHELGILIEGGASNTVAESTITNGNIGIHVSDTTNQLIEGNHLSHNNAGLFLVDTADSLVQNNVIEHSSPALHLHQSTNNTFTENTFGPNNFRAISMFVAPNNTFYRNNILSGQLVVTAGNTWNLPLPDGGNFWQSAFGTDADGDGIRDTPYTPVANITDELPWITQDAWENVTPPPAECCSNVAFLPGLLASELQTGENQLWLPNKDLDVKKLALDPVTGESVDPDIHTIGITETAYAVNIYKGFIDHMESLEGDVIQDFETLPYDWRMDVKDVATKRIALQNGSYTMVSRIEALASTSPTQKVTLITHSNGGLVAKELLTELERLGKAHLVDRVIMVSAPQLGTPKAINDMLHGMDPFFLKFPKRETTRELAENMKSAYTLLPSPAYFNSVGTPIARPIIEFDPSTVVTQGFRNIYGDFISNYNTLREFLLGENGSRSEPEPRHINTPNVLKEHFLEEAEVHQNEWSTWTPPEGVDVIEIVGFGLGTMRGIKYSSAKKKVCTEDLSVCQNISVIDPQPLITYEGDGTVVYTSAEALGGERYYVDLFDYNEETFIFPLVSGRDHKNILEVTKLQELISTLIQKQATTTLPQFISSEKPIISDAFKRLRIGVHSPVTLHLYDEFGRHTGPAENPDPDSDLEFHEEQIPNSYYWRIGEGQYVGTGDATTTIELLGFELGTFTLVIEEVLGDETSTTTVFADIPTTASTTARMQAGGNTKNPVLLIDIDGDGETDVELSPDEEVSDIDFFILLKGVIKTLDLDKKKEKRLLNRSDKIIKLLEKEDKCDKKKTDEKQEKCEDKFEKKLGKKFDRFTKLIEKFEEKGILSSDEAQELITIVEQLEGEVVE